MKKTISTFSLLMSLFLASFAQLSPISVSIPMRDGKVLAGDLYLPDSTKSYPTILIQTPYSKASFQLSGLPLGIGYDITNSEYAFLIVDWRCYFQSLSACTLMNERGEDGYDVVEWIAVQSWSDGNVGTWGPSALGSIQFQTAKEQPPHLRCAVPIVVSPQIHYGKYFPGGVARVDYLSFVGSYFGFGSFIVGNPYHNLLWTFTEDGSMYPAEIDIPMMIIGGWFDHNTDDCMQMFDTLRRASTPAVRDQHRLLMGPWTHNRVGNPTQGDLSFSNAANWDDSLALRFFDYHLRQDSNQWEQSPKIQYYQVGENAWKHSDAWPPMEADESQIFYLQEDYSLNTVPAGYSEDSTQYIYDPEDPSPSVGGKIFNTNLLENTVGPLDISSTVEIRNDGLIYSTEVLSETLSVTGKIHAKLYFSSDRLDTDIALRLTDVYPDGRSILIAESIQRLHMRDGYTLADTVYMEPDSVYEIHLAFEHLAHSFLPGHRLRLIVTSSNYPRFNRNMNTGGPMYPNGNVDTLVNPLVATHAIHSGSLYPSSLSLPVTSPPVGNEALVKDSPIHIYPNPSTGMFVIEGLSGWEEIRIVDIQGRMVYKNVAGGSDSPIRVDASGIGEGIYLLKVTERSGSQSSTKIVLR